MNHKILNIVQEQPNLTLGEICTILNVRFDDVSAEFTDLIKQGYLLEKKVNKPNSKGRNEHIHVYTLGSKSFELNILKNVSSNINNKVFLSHASKDKRIANKFIDDILVNILGLSKEKDIFFTSHPESGVEPGHNWRDEIKTNLKIKEIFIAIISERYKKKEMCLAEIGAAWVLGKFVYQFAVPPIEKSKCSEVLNTNQAISLTNKDDIKSFIHSIKDKLQIKDLKNEIDDASIIRFVKSINNINTSIKKNLATPKIYTNDLIRQTKEQLSEEILLKSFTNITSEKNNCKKISADFLNNEIGAFLVWIDSLADGKVNTNAYVVSHAGNNGMSITEGQYKYENIWALKRYLNPKTKITSWGFICSDETCEVNEILTDKRISKGKHLFTVSWNKQKDLIEFYIDRAKVGDSKFLNWPKHIESNMTVGTWQNKAEYHYLNAKIGKIKILNGIEISAEYLDKEIREFNK